MIKIILRRLYRRLKYVFLFRSLSWKYESCQDCGHCFRLVWSVRDEIWERVMGNDDGILCLDCFVERAEKKGTVVRGRDFEIKIFLPE